MRRPGLRPAAASTIDDGFPSVQWIISILLLGEPMRPTVRQLEVFCSLAQAGSFTRAAANLNMSQPAFSQALAALEASLGVRLFERSRRSVALNPVAQIFLRRVEGILADLDGAVAELRSADDPSSGQLE